MDRFLLLCAGIAIGFLLGQQFPLSILGESSRELPGESRFSLGCKPDENTHISVCMGDFGFSVLKATPPSEGENRDSRREVTP